MMIDFSAYPIDPFRTYGGGNGNKIGVLKKMAEILSNPHEIDNRVYVFPTSALKQDGRKINYFDFITSHVNPDCTAALVRMLPRIYTDEINAFIERQEFLSALQKEFYRTMLRVRKEKILDAALERIDNGSTH